MRILLVEDEHRLSNVVKKGLVEEGFAVDQAFDGEEGLYLAESESYDLIILDLMLPKIDGIEVCLQLRKKKIRTPILMLTAKTKTEDKVVGLDSGADDYLTKPFAFAELKARIQALLRRSHNQVEPVFKIADLEVDPIKHLVRRAGKTYLAYMAVEELKKKFSKDDIIYINFENKTLYPLNEKLLDELMNYVFEKSLKRPGSLAAGDDFDSGRSQPG